MTDKQLLKLTKGFTKGVTNGNIKKQCYVVSAPLQAYLLMCKLETELIKVDVHLKNEIWEHYCIKLKDGRILDPTAGQFTELNLPSIYLGEMPTNYKLIIH